MQPLIALLSLVAFLYLAHESRQEIGYTHSEFDVLKPHKLTKTEALKDVWQLTDNDITKPIELFK